jgi:hypothetical protein
MEAGLSRSAFSSEIPKLVLRLSDLAFFLFKRTNDASAAKREYEEHRQGAARLREDAEAAERDFTEAKGPLEQKKREIRCSSYSLLAAEASLAACSHSACFRA